ncbi:hypothetical protein EQV77_13195 [Halobacillus fulvus]|nr:hypothetical protein EQV77_13195 [Halobacillus fulvus]
MLLIALSIVGYQRYQEVQHENDQWKLFLNHFYYSVDQSISRMDTMIERNPEGERLVEWMHDLEVDLMQSQDVLKHTHMFLESDLLDPNFFESASAFLPILTEDGELDEEEIDAMTDLRNRWAEVRDWMYSEETGQENRELELEDMNAMIQEKLPLHGGYEFYRPLEND